ncbi:MAG TPA: hypothetical protein VIM65_08475, partial [Cyclobacteriaceae bacterium]
HQLSMGLSKSLAHNANAILLTCFPDKKSVPLIALSKGIFKHSSEKEEWHSFLYGLNYSLSVLQSLYNNLSYLTDGARSFALALLYHQKFSLLPEHLEEMIRGLLGPGYFFDMHLLKKNPPSRILSKPEFFDKIVFHLNNADKQIAHRAASVLLDHHETRMNIQQKALALILQMEGYESYFFHLTMERSDILDIAELKDEIVAQASSRSQPTLLSLYLAAGSDPVGWKTFMTHGIARSEQSPSDALYQLYYWFLSYFRKYSALKSVISQVVQELLTVPVYQEQQYNNNIYLFLLMLADELGIDNKSTIKTIISLPRSIGDEELMCALFLRTQQVPTGYRRPYGNAHITLFTEYKPDFLSSVTQSEIDLQLVPSEHFSSKILPMSGRLLLNGQLDDVALQEMATKGKQGAFITTLINYIRDGDLPADRLFNLREIGSVREGSRVNNTTYRAIVYKITQDFLKDSENKKKYLGALKNALDQKKDSEFMDLLFELLEAEELPSSKSIEQLLIILLDIPWSLNEHLAFELSLLFADRLPDDMKPGIVSIINNILGALNQHYEQRSEDKNYAVYMLLALASIHLSGNVSEDARRSFLFGLQGVFLDREEVRFAFSPRQERIVFNGSALLNAVGPLYAKIPAETVASLLHSGLTANVPEIQAVCRLLYYFSGRANSGNVGKTGDAVIK